MANNRLFHSVKRAKALKKIPDLIASGDNPYETDNKGRTLLHYAAELGHVELVKYLLNSVKIHPNIQDNEGQTAMHRAATQHRVAVVKALCAAGGDVNACDKVGVRPLHLAAVYGYITVASTLVSKGADIFAKSYAAKGRGGLTAKEAASKVEQLKMVRVLEDIECSRNRETMLVQAPEPIFICSHDDVKTSVKTKEKQKS